VAARQRHQSRAVAGAGKAIGRRARAHHERAVVAAAADDEFDQPGRAAVQDLAPERDLRVGAERPLLRLAVA
jgi:hypothetical protein